MRTDRRLRGHPGPMLAKYEAEGRPRPTEALPMEAKPPPLHYHLAHQDSRVVLSEDGSPLLHHEALDYITAGTPERAIPESGPRRRTWLSVPQVARLLELDPSTVRDAIKDGQLPASQPTGEGGTWRIRISDFEDYLATHHYAHDHIRELRTTWTAWLAQVD